MGISDFLNMLSTPETFTYKMVLNSKPIGKCIYNVNQIGMAEKQFVNFFGITNILFKANLTFKKTGCQYRRAQQQGY